MKKRKKNKKEKNENENLCVKFDLCETLQSYFFRPPPVGGLSLLSFQLYLKGISVSDVEEGRRSELPPLGARRVRPRHGHHHLCPSPGPRVSGTGAVHTA
jgi:hypothetical protein